MRRARLRVPESGLSRASKAARIDVQVLAFDYSELPQFRQRNATKFGSRRLRARSKFRGDRAAAPRTASGHVAAPAPTRDINFPPSHVEQCGFLPR